MPLRLILAFCMAILPAGAAGTTPKAKPGDYPVQVEAPGFTIAAEFMGHTFGEQNNTFVAPGYLTVEVAIYPAKLHRVQFSSSQFYIRMNGKTQAVYAQSPQGVAASLKYHDWENERTLVAQAGPVIIGRPTPVERFPGDPTSQQQRLPRGPTASTDPTGVERTTQSAPEIAVTVALGEDPASGPVSGYLYFPYKGKLKSIRSLELVYEGGPQRLTLKLR